MDLCQQSKALVLVPFGESHSHRIGVERKAEHPGSIQKTPHNATPPLAAHEPLEVPLFGIPRQFVALLLVGGDAFLVADVEGVVVAHVRNLCGVGSVTRTLKEKAARRRPVLIQRTASLRYLCRGARLVFKHGEEMLSF